MPVDDADTRPLTRRERLRRQTADEIVARALELVDDGGAHGLSLASLGKAMGMTSPALYHYFASREALLDALVVAGYTELGTAVVAAAQEAAGQPAPDRLAAIAQAWRRWALDHPRRYSMLFTGKRRVTVDPFENIGPVARTMVALVSTLEEIAAGGRAPLRGTDDGGAHGRANGEADDDALDLELLRWGLTLDIAEGASTPALRLALSTWYRVHGLVSLEIVGAFETIGLDGGRLLAAEIKSLIAEAGRR